MKPAKNASRKAAPEERRYAIYARTAAGGHEHIQAQVQAARAAIAQDGGGGAAIKEYLEVNVAGAGAPGPGLSALLLDAAAGLFDLLVVTDVARLSRSAARAREILAAIEASGARVIFTEHAR